MNGKIIKILSNDYTVFSNNNLYVCKSRGKFRNLKITPVVGYEVIFDEQKKFITIKNFMRNDWIFNITFFAVGRTHRYEHESSADNERILVFDWNFDCSR